MAVELKVTEGRQQGSVIALSGKKFLIGREEDCHLRPNSDLVSRHHCVFTMDDFTVRLRDLGSTNGTYVNGERISGQVILATGDQIRIGKLAFEISIQTAVPSRVVASRDYTEGVPTSSDTISDFAIPVTNDVNMAAQQTVMLSGDTDVHRPQPKTKGARNFEPIPVKLPEPEDTGAREAVPVPVPAEGSAPAEPKVAPQNTAADIIRQYRQQRPNI